MTEQRVLPFIWFAGNAEDAMNFYVKTFNRSRIVHIERYTGDQGIPDEDRLRGKVLNGTFEIEGQTFMCLDGGPVFEPGGNISLMVILDSQTELDEVWEKLLDGGSPQQCGWITDKFGTTWQIVPRVLDEMMRDPNTTARQRKAITAAMMPMVKLEGQTLKRAWEEAGR